MGICLGKETREIKHPPNSLDLPNIVNIMDTNVHVVEYNQATKEFVVLYRNFPAMSMYGDYDMTRICQMFTDAILAEMIETVIGRSLTWHRVICDNSHMGNGQSLRCSEENTSPRQEVPKDVSIYFGSSSKRYQRALLALHEQRKSLHLSRSTSNGGITPCKKWYDFKCYPFKNHILIMQQDISKHMERDHALLHITDNHLRLLQQIYPRHFIMDASTPIEKGSDDLSRFSKKHDNVAVMFADIVGFTNMCKLVDPTQVMSFLSSLYEQFDNALSSFQHLFKYEIAGDCYIVIGGVAARDANGFMSLNGVPFSKNIATMMIKYAIAIQSIARTLTMPHDPSQKVQIRIGIHIGPAVSGIIGKKSPKFMLFGDTMNTASRMESTCPPDMIQVTDMMFSYLQGVTLEHGSWTKTNGVVVKGKGVMDTWILDYGSEEGEPRDNENNGCK
jgi:class 3 adenylate cyclase